MSRADVRRSSPSRPLARGRPFLGYALVVTAAAFAGLNAAAGKVAIVSGGVPPIRLAEFRATAAAGILVAAIALGSPGRFTPRRNELPFIAVFGVVGLALGQYTYLVSVQHLDVGVALLIINLAVVLVAVWGRVSGHEHVSPRLWLAVALALAGLALVAELWRGVVLSATGVAAALSCALTYAVYALMADRSAKRQRPAWFLVGWGFFFAAVFWALVQPWWSFPFEVLGEETSLLGRLEDATAPVWLLVAYVVLFGTIGVFVMYAAALRYIPPTHFMIAAVLEPVFGTIVAFAWLGETLASLQLVGGALVIAAVVLGQTARAEGEGVAEREPLVPGEPVPSGGEGSR